ncbi:MAG TPA: threonine aldolase family protein [Candidatus Obscuribacterales bacterium]
MIDLFSDSASQPTSAMRHAMALAEVGDEQRGTDPTVLHLLEMVCDLLGKEAALFLPSGTMCNAIAVKVHTQPGDVLLVDQQSHVLRSEAGGAAMWSGVVIDQVASASGIFTRADLLERLPASSVYAPPPRLLSIEQTHNFGGGTVWPLAQITDVCAAAHEHGLFTHLDGARLLNAVVATGVSAKTWCAHFDSVFIDFSKSLGAPFGAVLAGNQQFIQKARRYKQAFGGAMRQAGIMAAACIYALENNIERLAQDHENAVSMAAELQKIAGLRVLTPRPDTNMVFFDTSEAGMTAWQFLEEIKTKGVIMSEIQNHVRLVTHLGISKQDCQTAISVVQQVMAAKAAATA